MVSAVDAILIITIELDSVRIFRDIVTLRIQRDAV